MAWKRWRAILLSATCSVGRKGAFERYCQVGRFEDVIRSDRRFQACLSVFKQMEQT